MARISLRRIPKDRRFQHETCMTSNLLASHSLKIRITLAMLGIFLAGIWVLEIYASRTLHEDMQNLLSEQQASAIAFMAADLDNEFGDRFKSLEGLAAEVAPVMAGNPASLLALLNERPVFQIPFNGGIIVYGSDGKEIVRATLSAGRIGGNSRNGDYVVDPLNEGKRNIGKPYFSESKRFPEFVMTVPIRGIQGNVIGALGGVVNLAKPNFLDDVSRNPYSKTGDYLLVAPQHRLIVTSSDKSRIMERLPAPGVNPVTDLFDTGEAISAITVNPHGVEVLASAKGIRSAGWIVAAVLPTEEAFAPIRAMKQRMLLATIFLSIMVAAVTAWVLRSQLSPMFSTARTLGLMSENDQPLQPLTVFRQDELGQLVSGFNRLLVSLEARNCALRESETVLKESQVHAGLGSYVLDISTGRWKSSAVLDDLFGIDETYDHSVEGWVALIHPDDRPVLVDYFRDEVLGRGQNFDKIYRITRHDDGVGRWVHGLGRMEFDAQQRPLKMSGTIQDISERKQAEDALRESHRQLRDLASSLQTVREEERTALARELHDEVGQQLLRLRMDLSWLAGRIKNQAPGLLEKVEGMKRFIDGSVHSLRHLTTELRLPLLDDLGLAAAALWVLDDFSQRTGIEVESAVALDDTEMEEQATINLFRILQESLTNVTRHAGATKVTVSLGRTEEFLVLDVRDNGRGTELRDKPKLGHGLVGIRERALRLGGRMEIASAPGEGFAIHVYVPLKASEIKGEQT